jgi:hypothetical protein
MRLILPLLVVAVHVIATFLPWITVETKDLTITGVDTTGTTYGVPAYFHFFWLVIYTLLMLVNRVWSRRAAMIVAAFNFAWAARNFLLIPACQMGECPVRRIGLYLLLLSAFALIFAGLLAPGRKTAELADNPGGPV